MQQTSITWQGDEDDYITNEDDHKRNREEKFVAIKLLHIGEMFWQIIVEDLPTNRSIQWTTD